MNSGNWQVCHGQKLKFGLDQIHGSSHQLCKSSWLMENVPTYILKSLAIGYCRTITILMVIAMSFLLLMLAVYGTQNCMQVVKCAIMTLACPGLISLLFYSKFNACINIWLALCRTFDPAGKMCFCFSSQSPLSVEASSVTVLPICREPECDCYIHLKLHSSRLLLLHGYCFGLEHIWGTHKGVMAPIHILESSFCYFGRTSS